MRTLTNFSKGYLKLRNEFVGPLKTLIAEFLQLWAFGGSVCLLIKTFDAKTVIG